MLAARSLIETMASLHSFEKELRPALESEDLAKLNELTLHHSFATKDKRMLDEHIGFEATNVLTLVDKLERQFEIDGLRDGYDRLSERCHPNAAGHYFFFGMLDPDWHNHLCRDKKQRSQSQYSSWGVLAPWAGQFFACSLG